MDTLILGAGIAGAAAALNLAPMRRVALIDAGNLSAENGTVGESLAPAACRLLADMGLLESFLAEGHSPWYGTRSSWGTVVPTETDSLRNLDGPGWHLNRTRFNRWLRAAAAERSAELMWPAQLRSVEADEHGWVVDFTKPEGRGFAIRARTLIDATGRSASLARRFGSQHESSEPRMLCAWLRGTAKGETAATAGFTTIEAVQDGWWYTAPLPCGYRIVAFHTDSDLPARRMLRSAESFMEYAERAPLVSETLMTCGFNTRGELIRWTVASGGTLSPPAGQSWFAAGDAAIHFDPLSSQGLVNALFTGLACAEATDRLLEGSQAKDVAEGYQTLIRQIRDAYVFHRMAWYREERRWSDSLFWSRRHSPVSAPVLPLITV